MQNYSPPLPTYLPLPPNRRLPRRRRRTGCYVFGCLLTLIAPLACFAVLLLAYLIFPPTPVDIVMLGVDARPGERYLTRTDSIMLANITPGKLQVNLLSIPRDVFIVVPGYGEQRINTINVLGEQEAEGNGPALVKASFRESFGVDVEHYMRVDFHGFVALVDAVGGIDVEVPKEIVDYEYPTENGGTIEIHFEPGRQHMDGETALQYARTRHADDDYRRAERQQQVVDALVRKLSNPVTVVRLPRVWQVLHDSTDTDLSTWDMLRLAPALVLGWPSHNHRVIDREDLLGSEGGYAVPNYDQLLPWIASHFD